MKSTIEKVVINMFEGIVRGTPYHWYVGNDSHPALVAMTRAIVGAFISGSLGFLVAWQATDQVKVLIIAGVQPALTYLGIRFGIEGLVDTAKYKGPPENGG